MKPIQERTIYMHDFTLKACESPDAVASCGYSLLKNGDSSLSKTSYVSTPWHGRSMHWYENGGFHVLKGGGIPYLEVPYYHSGEMEGHVWGGLSEHEAIREWEVLKSAQEWGIQCASPVALFQYNFDPCPIGLHSFKFFGWLYRLSNPYRLIDLEFLGKDGVDMLRSSLREFGWLNGPLHMGLAVWLAKTLASVRRAGWLHNAVTTHNITLSLELLDFESSCRLDDPGIEVNMVHALLDRERIHAMEVVFYVSFWLEEPYCANKIANLFEDELRG